MPEIGSGLAPAKINLVLEVLGKRPDGFHEIATVFQEIELADRVTVSLGGEGCVAASGPYAEETPRDATNLAWRAAAVLAEMAGHDVRGLSIDLVKEIPAAGGLGGGASDAAAVLRILARAWPEATPAMVQAAATVVGSDAAFFLAGGTAFGNGRGELIAPLPALPVHDLVLFIPPFTLERKTERMFSALGKLPFDRGGAAADFAASLPRMVSPADLFNAFERVAWDLFPGLERLHSAVEARIGGPVRLAGAGPTLFWIGPPGKGDAVAAVAAPLDCTVILTRSAGGR